MGRYYSRHASDSAAGLIWKSPKLILVVPRQSRIFVFVFVSQILRRHSTASREQHLLDRHGEAAVIAWRLSDPPKGSANWTLDLLQERVIALSFVDSVSRETLRQTLKKWNDAAQKLKQLYPEIKSG